MKKLIESLEEKRFYDIALLYLTAQGYNDVRIIDGSGDGGRDVATSRSDLRIQLSVRKDWQTKINDETELTLSKGKRHLLYITNRSIPDSNFSEFRASGYKLAGEVEISLIDLKALSSALALPGISKRTYEVLGIQVGDKVIASVSEIAISSYLLFSSDARDLRQEIFESNIKAFVYKNASVSEIELIGALSNALPGANVENDLRRFAASLRSRKILHYDENKIYLTDDACAQMKSAELDYLTSIASDTKALCEKYKLEDTEARELIEMSLELIARGEQLDGNDVFAISLLQFIADKGLGRRKQEIFEDLSSLNQAKIKGYGEAVNHIFSTNTFDIFRALGRHAEVVMVLDSSVAMPMMFGLSFGPARSRYGLAASALHDVCAAHGISIKVPRCYLNEMASHGCKALEFLTEYDLLDSDLKSFLRESGNAYLSHFSHAYHRGDVSSEYTLARFLEHFGIRPGASMLRIENKIESILSSFDIGIIDEGRYAPEIRLEIAKRKPEDYSLIVDHDAKVATYLKNRIDVGFIFATWDKALIDVVEGLSRIFAANPARIMDFLSMAVGSDYEARQSVSLLTTLLYIDEKKTAEIATKIEKIRSVERMHELNDFVSELRESKGGDFSPDDAVVQFFGPIADTDQSTT
ncbi:MAG: hypothetical protein AB7E72_17830 [Lysobacterales bacterium]